MSYIAYPRYEESGVEWIGQVPDGWKVHKLGHALSQPVTDGPHLTPDFISDGIPFLSVDGIQDGELIFEGCRFVSEDDHREFRKKAYPQKGDILFGKAASTGKIARVKVNREFSIWSPLALLKIDENMSTSNFIEYSLKSRCAQSQIDVLCTHNTQSNISMDDIPRLMIAFPPLDEQHQIAAFLDTETAKLDTLIEKKRELIERLKEKRTALISRTVTCGLPPDAAIAAGLDPHPKLKPSGVEWLGEIPAHWELKPLGYVTASRGGATPDKSNQEFWDGDIPWISPKDMKRAVISDGEDHISTEALNSSPLSLIPSPAVLIVVRGMILAHSFPVALTSAGITINQDMKALICHRSVHPEFLYWSLSGFASAFVALTEESAHGTRRLESSTIARFPLLMPLLSEQAAIVSFLDRETAKIDCISETVQSAVERVLEYRSALITSAVTGKIDVRGCAP